MVINSFDPPLLGSHDTFRLTPGKHGTSRLRFGSSKDVGSGIGGILEDSRHSSDRWFSEVQPLTTPRRYFDLGFNERLHRATDRSGSPKGLDQLLNRVFCS